MNLWQRKLLAYLHDPLNKALAIRDHDEHPDVAANLFAHR